MDTADDSSSKGSRRGNHFAPPKIDRRKFLKVAGIAGGSAITGAALVTLGVKEIEDYISNLPKELLEALPLNSQDLLISLLSPLKGAQSVSTYLESDQLTLNGRATIVQIDNSDAGQTLTAIANTVEKHIAEKGPLNTLMISADGNTNIIAVSESMIGQETLPDFANNVPVAISGVSDNFPFEVVNVKSILSQLLEIQQTRFDGAPLAKRFICTACDVASNLSKNDAFFYSDMAKKLGFPIILATTQVAADGIDPDAGHFVQFNPQGTVTVSSINNEPADPSQEAWLKYFDTSKVEFADGKTQADTLSRRELFRTLLSQKHGREL